MTFTFSRNMNCGINDISFESFKPSMANAQLQALQYVQNKFGGESLFLGGHRKVLRLLSMLLYLLFKLIIIDFNEVISKYIKIYHSSFYFTHLYIKKKLHGEQNSSIYTEAYIFDTYIFGVILVCPLLITGINKHRALCCFNN
jgi:hypothetical protein